MSRAAMKCCCLLILALVHAAIGEQPAKPVTTVGDVPSRRSQRSRREMREKSMINSLKHIGDWGSEAVSCASDCRYGEVKHTWKVCVDRCVDNPLLRSVFLSMLPEHALDSESTDGELKPRDPVRRKLLLSRMRSAEL
mmetsp:Transcript_34584/g.78147  ORF Transcript_34584/g.78147 Transcript_34584/m.78147 type:complete len:138 (+) Transcript_34584:77-490(+)